MAEGFILDRLRERLAGIDGLTIARPVGTHPLLARIVAETAEATTRARGWRAQEVVLLLAGHGTPRHPASGAAAAALAVRLREAGAWAAVETAFLEQAPLLGARLSALAEQKVVVVGVFVDAGPHGKDDVEEAVGAAPGPVAYTGPIGASPAIRTILRERAGLV
jgi:sirohydrochlorin ferrochelatase